MSTMGCIVCQKHIESLQMVKNQGLKNSKHILKVSGLRVFAQKL